MFLSFCEGCEVSVCKQPILPIKAHSLMLTGMQAGLQAAHLSKYITTQTHSPATDMNRRHYFQNLIVSL